GVVSTALHEAGKHDLVVDLRAVRFMDSTGLGVLVGVLKRVRLAGGSLSLVIDSERILKVFRITALTQIFDIFDSVGDALTATPSEPEAASPADPCPASAGAGPPRAPGPSPSTLRVLPVV